MNDGANILSVVETDQVLFGPSKEEAAQDKKKAFIGKEAVKDLSIGPTTITKKLKKEFGEGMDFYTVKEVMASARKEAKAKKKQTPKNRDLSKEEYNRRVSFAMKTLRKHPGMSHVDLNKLAVRKHGREITAGIYKKFSVTVKPAQSSRTVGVKASLKSNTTPLREETKKLGKFFLACGIEKASMVVVNGVPQWDLDRRIDVIVTKKDRLSF